MILKRLIFRSCYYPLMSIAHLMNFLNQCLYNKLVFRVLIMGGVKITGRPRYISSDVYLDNFHLIELGDEVVISKRVTFLTHDFSITTGLVAVNERPKEEQKTDGRIKIGRNVFIGLGTTLLPGTTIGDNVIVGACSVVKGVIPANCVVAGNPARVLCSISDYMMKQKKRMKNRTVF